MEVPRAPLPLFSVQIEIQKCIETFIRNSKKKCFSFTLETDCYKVNYSQQGTRKNKKLKRTFCQHPDPDLEEEYDENEDEMDEDQGTDKWTEVRHRRKNTRLKDFEILIPKYNSNSGIWQNAKDVYENDQPGYIPKEHDWRCLLCHNINFEWRKSCNNPNCGAPRGQTKKQADHLQEPSCLTID